MKIFLKFILVIWGILFLFSLQVLSEEAPTLMMQLGHSGPVYGLALSDDGRFVVSASSDNTLKLWDFETGREMRTFRGHLNAVFCAAISPDGKYVASGCWDGTVKTWDIETGKEKSSFKAHEKAIIRIMYSPDGLKLATASWDNKVKLWNLKDEKTVATIKGDDINAYAFTSDFQNVVMAENNGVIKIASFDDIMPPKTIAKSGDKIEAIAISKDKKTIVISTSANNLIAIDASSGKTISTMKGHKETISAIAISNDGKSVVSGSNDKSVKIWDLRSGREIRTLKSSQLSAPIYAVMSPISHARAVNCVLLTPDGRYVLSGGSDNNIFTWDVKTGAELRNMNGNCYAVKASQITSDNRYLMCEFDDGTLAVWDLMNGKEIYSMKIYSVGASHFSTNGKYVATTPDSITIELWDYIDRRLIQTFRGHEKLVRSLCFSPDGKYLVTGSNDKNVVIWEISSGKALKTCTGHKAEVNSVAYSPDGNYFASGANDNNIRIWEAPTGYGRSIMKGHEGNIYGVVFSQDSKYIASASLDKTVRLWKVSTGKEERKFTGHREAVIAVAISPDNKYIASGGVDENVKLWNLATGAAVQTFKGHTGYILNLSYTSDSKYLISGSFDASMRVWDLKNKSLLVTLAKYRSKDWVVVSADGRFDGVENGFKELHFVQGMNVIPLESFFERYFTPGLLGKVISKGPMADIWAGFDMSKKQVKMPPDVRILSPAAGQTFTTEQVDIVVEATDKGGGVDEIKLYQNGKLVSEEQRGMKNTSGSGKTIQKTFKITLLTGVNIFKATAFNSDRTEANPVQLQIELKGAEANADLYLFVIGVNEYKNSKYNLNYGVADAGGIVTQLEKTAKRIFRTVTKLEIYNKDAVKGTIETAFKSISQRARPQDAFVFFYAGHGVMSSDSGQGTQPDFYLVLYDITQMYGDDDQLIARGISAEALKKYCTAIKAQKQLILLDACQSGGAVTAFASRGVAEEKAIAQLNRSAGVAVLASTGTEQNATEFKQLGHGVFTYALLAAIGGEADGSPKDGKVTVSEIKAYIEDQVPELTKKYRGTAQYPNSSTRGMDFPVGTVPTSR
jgi:WD40 repeat protein